MSARIDFSSSSDDEVGAAEEDEQLKGFVREIRTNYKDLVEKHVSAVSDAQARDWLFGQIDYYLSNRFPPDANKEHVFRVCCSKIHMSRIDFETDSDHQRPFVQTVCAFLKYFEEQYLIPKWREYKATRGGDASEYKATRWDDPSDDDMI